MTWPNALRSLRTLGAVCSLVWNAHRCLAYLVIDDASLGGLPYQQQEVELKRKPDIVVATPGRLIDHLKNSVSFALDTIEIRVLDEADRCVKTRMHETCVLRCGHS